MAKKEITQTTQQSDKKLRTKDLIYAGAFGAIYIVLMLIIVLGTSAIPVLYIVAPFTVGLVCATVYELCVLKVHKFGPALILGVLFALVACSGNVLGMALAILAAVVAELIIVAGKYKSKKDHFAFSVEVSVSPTFFAWVFEFGGKIKIINPQSVIDEYYELLKKSLPLEMN